MFSYFRLFLVLFQFKGCFAPACTSSPTYLWPLGVGNACNEVISDTTSGATGVISYATGYVAIEMFSAMTFHGSNDSYADLTIPNIQNPFLVDYSIKFYVYFEQVINGTVLHYRSDSYDGIANTTEIRDIKISVLNGIVEIRYTDFGSIAFPELPISAGQWYSFIYERDISKKGPKFYIGLVGYEKDIGDLVKVKVTSFPGTLRIGSDFMGSDPMSGQLACLQIYQCKSATDTTFETYCKTQSTTSTTTTSTASTSTTVSTTTTEPSTSTTSRTTSTTETSTSTTSRTTSTTEASTSTTSKTTSTTEAPTSTSTITTKSPSSTTTVKTTTTDAIPTVTTTEPTTTITTTNAPPITTISPTTTGTLMTFDVTDFCTHYTKMEEDATFGSIFDIIDTTVVSSVEACAKACDRVHTCFSFAAVQQGTFFICTIGNKSPMTTSLIGSSVFEL